MSKNKRFAALRRDYKKSLFDEQHCARSPYQQFERWFAAAEQCNLIEPNAMALATADRRARPSVRMVLLKDIRRGAFCFFTSYRSRKGQELEENRTAALLFYWPELERQVRIEGVVARLPERVSDRYFSHRPPGAQLSAAISPQSAPIASRSVLEKKRSALEQAIRAGEALLRPDSWGGYGLTPTRFEFWQGRADRLHDRICYKKVGRRWRIERLAP